MVNSKKIYYYIKKKFLLIFSPYISLYRITTHHIFNIQNSIWPFYYFLSVCPPLCFFSFSFLLFLILIFILYYLIFVAFFSVLFNMTKNDAFCERKTHVFEIVASMGMTKRKREGKKKPSQSRYAFHRSHQHSITFSAFLYIFFLVIVCACVVVVTIAKHPWQYIHIHTQSTAKQSASHRRNGNSSERILRNQKASRVPHDAPYQSTKSPKDITITSAETMRIENKRKTRNTRSQGEEVAPAAWKQKMREKETRQKCTHICREINGKR